MANTGTDRRDRLQALKPVGNHKFMGIVIGAQESICCIDKNLESKQIHMNAVMDRKKQDAILSKLRISTVMKNSFCIRLAHPTQLSKGTQCKEKNWGTDILEKTVFRVYDL